MVFLRANVYNSAFVKFLALFRLTGELFYLMQALLYRKLSELVERFNTERSGKRSGWVKRLFESLDWGRRSAYTIESDNSQGYSLLVDNFPMVNVLVDSPNNVDPVYSALNRAYNQDVPWVVATDFQSLGVFGSYWVSFPHDVSSALGLRMESSEYLAEAHNLEILTPHAVAQNTLNELYDSFTGRKRRVPIDLHFIERMGQWRQLVLHALEPSSVGSDKLVHRLINTLFLIRYLEDCRLTQDRLLDIANEQSDIEFTQRLHLVFDQTAFKTGYTVPTKSELANLQQAPLRGLLGQLYGYPEYGVNYDFAAMNVDILGRFYEEYLRKDVVRVDETKAVRTLFERPTYRLEDVRREHGIYFTPRFIVDYILNNLISRFRDRHASNDLPFILDIAAGSGTFLSAAIDHIVRAYRMRNGFADVANHLIGLDADSRAIEAARLNLTARLLGQAISKRPPPLKLGRVDLILGGPEEAKRDSLIPPDGADIIVGNPPFIKYEWLKKQYHVPDFSIQFETAMGRTDSYIMFVEAAVKLLREGGYGGLVLPNNILRTRTAGPLRNWLSKHVDVLEIIDFLDQRVFQGVSAYVCILLFRKRSTEKVSGRTMVARIYEVSGTPASQLASLSVAQSDESLEGSEVFWVDPPSGRGPWNLRNRTELELLELLREVSDDSVESALNLRQGVKTGGDPIFIVEGSQMTEGLYLLTGRQKPYAIERGLLIPVLRNRDLRRWGSRATAFLIYPYDRESGKLLPWKTIETEYPRTAAYLESHKVELSGRRSLRGKKWYSLIEPRFQTISSDMPTLAAAEISLRPVISRPVPQDAALVGNAWLTLRNRNYDLDVVMTYLNSSIAEWYLRQVSPLLQGGYILLRQTNLSKLHLPRFLKASDTFARDELKRLAVELVKASTESDWRANPSIRNEIESAEEQIDVLIMEALRLKSSHAEQIRRSITLTRQLKQND